MDKKTEEEILYSELWLQHQQLNGGCGSPFMVVIVLAIVLALSCCTTKKKFVEIETNKTEISVDSTVTQKTQKDSANVSHTTNVIETEYVEHNKEVEKHDSTVLFVNEQGNVVKQETWHKEKEIVVRNREYEKLLQDSIAWYKSSVDSLVQYRARCDSLTEIINHKEVKVVKTPKNFKFLIVSLVLSILCCIFAIIKFVKYGSK